MGPACPLINQKPVIEMLANTENVNLSLRGKSATKLYTQCGLNSIEALSVVNLAVAYTGSQQQTGTV